MFSNIIHCNKVNMVFILIMFIPVRGGGGGKSGVPAIQSRKFNVDNFKSNLVKSHSYIHVIFNFLELSQNQRLSYMLIMTLMFL